MDSSNDIKQHFMKHIEDSNMSVLQKEKLSYFGKDIKLIRKDYIIKDSHILYMIIFEIGGEIISYKYVFHKDEFYKEIDSKFHAMFLSISYDYPNPNKHIMTINNKYKPTNPIFQDERFSFFTGCRLFKEIIDFINKIMTIDNVPIGAQIKFDELEFYRKSLLYIKPLFIPPRLEKFINKEDIIIEIDDKNFKPYESFLHNAKHHYVLTQGDRYTCKFIDDNTKLCIYSKDSDEPEIITLKKYEIDSFAKFFKV
jgi:hypothetical protein